VRSTPQFRLTHGGPAPARQALRAPADGSHLPPVSEFRTDDSASGFDESGGSKFVMRKVLRIKRVAPVESETERPLVTSKGYKMADPGGPDRPRPSYAIFHRTLEGVLGGLQRGLSLWMQEPQKGEALIPANKLRVVYS
jgi:hypothetical protein